MGQGRAATNRESPHFTFDEGAQGSTNTDLNRAGHQGLAQHIMGRRVLGGQGSVADPNYESCTWTWTWGTGSPERQGRYRSTHCGAWTRGSSESVPRRSWRRGLTLGARARLCSDPTAVDSGVAALVEAVWWGACAFQAATLLKRHKAWNKAVPWWTPELSVLKARFGRACNERRRSVQHEEEFQRDRLAFSLSMCTAKMRSRSKFCRGEVAIRLGLQGHQGAVDQPNLHHQGTGRMALMDNFFPEKAAEATSDADNVANAQERATRDNLSLRTGAAFICLMTGTMGRSPLPSAVQLQSQEFLTDPKRLWKSNNCGSD